MFFRVTLLQEQEGVVAVYRLEPDVLRGQCIFSSTLSTPAQPVCLYFSPSNDFLVLGTANASLYDNQHIPESVLKYHMLAANIMGYESPVLAYIYAIDRKTKESVEQTGRMNEVMKFSIPECIKSIGYENRSRSLNTILWHRCGLAYGSSKGLVVMFNHKS